LTQLGELSLWIALLMSAWCATLSVQGMLMRRPAFVESGARGLHASLFFLVIAVGGLAAAFLSNDFAVRYVAMHSGLALADFYKVCALWSGREGTLLVSALLLGALSSAVVAIARRHAKRRDGWTIAMLGLASCAVIALCGFSANPFVRAVRAPVDGRGLDPYLQDPAMAAHPPLVMLAAAAIVVTIAFAVGALTRKRGEPGQAADAWGGARWGALLSWTLLSAAILTALHWNYVSPVGRTLWASPAIIKGAFVPWALFAMVLVVFVVRDRAVTEAQSLRRYAGAVFAVAGAAVMVSGIAARKFERNYVVQLRDGEQYRATDAWGHSWTFTSQGASRLERPGADVTAVALMPARDGVRQPFMTSESREYYGVQGLNIFPPITVAAIRSSVAQDVYVMLSDAGEGTAALRISFRPLVELVWIGGVLFALGGVLLLWPPGSGGAA
jgi:cytochrome c biogenesis factor